MTATTTPAAGGCSPDPAARRSPLRALAGFAVGAALGVLVETHRIRGTRFWRNRARAEAHLRELRVDRAGSAVRLQNKVNEVLSDLEEGTRRGAVKVQHTGGLTRVTFPDDDGRPVDTDPTGGRIDCDLQWRANAEQPRDVGQRVALENNLQRRRDRGQM